MKGIKINIPKRFYHQLSRAIATGYIPDESVDYDVQVLHFMTRHRWWLLEDLLSVCRITSKKVESYEIVRKELKRYKCKN